LSLPASCLSLRPSCWVHRPRFFSLKRASVHNDGQLLTFQRRERERTLTCSTSQSNFTSIRSRGRCRFVAHGPCKSSQTLNSAAERQMPHKFVGRLLRCVRRPRGPRHLRVDSNRRRRNMLNDRRQSVPFASGPSESAVQMPGILRGRFFSGRETQPAVFAPKVKLTANMRRKPAHVLIDHPQSGVVYNFGRVRLSVCLSVRR